MQNAVLIVLNALEFLHGMHVLINNVWIFGHINVSGTRFGNAFLATRALSSVAVLFFTSCAHPRILFLSKN